MPHNKSITGKVYCEIPMAHTTTGPFLLHYLSSRREHTISSSEPPAQDLQKELQRWIQEATPLCGEYAYALRTHITSLQPAVVLMTTTQRHQTTTTHPPPPWLPTCIHITNHHHARIPRPRKSTAHRASHPLQMTHVWLVSWLHI